jgi:hypothetical protein
MTHLNVTFSTFFGKNTRKLRDLPHNSAAYSVEMYPNYIIPSCFNKNIRELSLCIAVLTKLRELPRQSNGLYTYTAVYNINLSFKISAMLALNTVVLL